LIFRRGLALEYQECNTLHDWGETGVGNKAYQSNAKSVSAPIMDFGGVIRGLPVTVNVHEVKYRRKAQTILIAIDF
jgi:hypothetical protein